MKKAWPQHDVTVYERNRSDDTFGFGVVFSDETLDTFESYDRESYRAITETLRLLGRHRDPFQGHRAPHRRQRLLRLLARTTLLRLSAGARAARSASSCGSRPRSTDLDAVSPNADLVVGADGINSRVRQTFAEQFKPSVDLRPNKFSWMGSTRPLDAFTFFFRETEDGIFIAHCYQYEPGRSTWVMETDPETFERAGLDRLDEEQSARLLEERVRATNSTATG